MSGDRERASLSGGPVTVASARTSLTPDKDWTMLERRIDWLKRAQFDEVKSQITDRLPHLRNRIAGDEFDQIVRGLTLVRLKCEVNRIPQLPTARAAEAETIRHQRAASPRFEGTAFEETLT